MEKIEFRVRHKKEIHFNLFAVITFIIMVLYAAALLGLLAWGIMTSFKDIKLDFLHNKAGLPEEWVFNNYITAFEELVWKETETYFEILYLNGFLYALGCAATATIVPCLVGYVCAKYNYKLSRIIFLVVIIVMIVPIVGNLPAEIHMANEVLGIGGHIWGMWIMKANFLGLYFIVFYNFFKALPNAYNEAAKIDGAGNFKTMASVILPMALPIFLTVFLLNFITFWNDFQTPLIYLDETYPTISMALYSAAQATATDGSGKSEVPFKTATATLVILPVLILFLAFHKKLLGNLTMGGIKG